MLYKVSLTSHDITQLFLEVLFYQKLRLRESSPFIFARESKKKGLGFTVISRRCKT